MGADIGARFLLIMIGGKCHFLNVPRSFFRACERLFEPERQANGQNIIVVYVTKSGHKVR